MRFKTWRSMHPGPRLHNSFGCLLLACCSADRTDPIKRLHKASRGTSNTTAPTLTSSCPQIGPQVPCPKRRTALDPSPPNYTASAAIHRPRCRPRSLFCRQQLLSAGDGHCRSPKGLGERNGLRGPRLQVARVGTTSQVIGCWI